MYIDQIFTQTFPIIPLQRFKKIIRMTSVITLNDGSRGIPPLIPRNPPPMNPPMLISPSLDQGCCGSNSEANVDVTSLFPMVTVDGFDGDDGLS